jgi:hypothetical protein
MAEPPSRPKAFAAGILRLGEQIVSRGLERTSGVRGMCDLVLS